MLGKWLDGREPNEITAEVEEMVNGCSFYGLESLVYLHWHREQMWPLEIVAVGDDSLVLRLRQGRLDLAIKLYAGTGLPKEMLESLIETTYLANPPGVMSSLTGEIGGREAWGQLAQRLEDGDVKPANPEYFYELVLNQILAATIGRAVLREFGELVIVPAAGLTFDGMPVGIAMRYEKGLVAVRYTDALPRYPELLIVKRMLGDYGVELDEVGTNILVGSGSRWATDANWDFKLVDLRVVGI